MPKFHIEIHDAFGAIQHTSISVVGDFADALAQADSLAHDLAARNRDNPLAPDSYAVLILNDLRQSLMTVVVKG